MILIVMEDDDDDDMEEEVNDDDYYNYLQAYYTNTTHPIPYPQRISPTLYHGSMPRTSTLTHRPPPAYSNHYYIEVPGSNPT